MSSHDVTSDLQVMQSHLVAEFLELCADAGATPSADALTICSILVHPDSRLIPAGASPQGVTVTFAPEAFGQ